MECNSAVMKQCSSGSFLELKRLAGCRRLREFAGCDVGGRQWQTGLTDNLTRAGGPWSFVNYHPLRRPQPTQRRDP